jgi:predicted membrane protein
MRLAVYAVLFLVLWRAGAAAIAGDRLVAAIVGALAAAVMLAPLVGLVEAVRWRRRRQLATRSSR